MESLKEDQKVQTTSKYIKKYKFITNFKNEKKIYFTF